MAGALVKKSSLTIMSEKIEGGDRTYRAASASRVCNGQRTTASECIMKCSDAVDCGLPLCLQRAGLHGSSRRLLAALLASGASGQCRLRVQAVLHRGATSDKCLFQASQADVDFARRFAPVNRRTASFMVCGSDSLCRRLLSLVSMTLTRYPRGSAMSRYITPTAM